MNEKQVSDLADRMGHSMKASVEEYWEKFWAEEAEPQLSKRFSNGGLLAMKFLMNKAYVCGAYAGGLAALDVLEQKDKEIHEAAHCAE